LSNPPGTDTNGNGGRAGIQALTLLAVPLNVAVLKALGEKPLSLMELRRAAGSPPATTMRGHLRTLVRTGVVVKTRRNGFPGTLDFELGPPGAELLAVADVLDRWLGLSPNDPLPLGSPPARNAIKALAEGWNTSMVRALCAKRLSLTELSGLITSVSYPSLERRVTAMRLADLIEPCPGGGRSTPYAVTEWLRRSVAPLAAAVRWERRHADEAAPPLRRRDAEAVFLLALPLVRLDPDSEGSCRLVVEHGRGEGQTLSGVTLSIREGQLSSCTSRLEGQAETWAVGPVSAWLDAIVDAEWSQLELGGDVSFARDLVEAMNGVLTLKLTPAG
jgi:DNA-binding HxlR family transcriptional regulator